MREKVYVSIGIDATREVSRGICSRVTSAEIVNQTFRYLLKVYVKFGLKARGEALSVKPLDYLK